MANNWVELIQKNLGFPPLRKIDPNIQEAREKSPGEVQAKLAQAAIPAVLTALYRFTRSDEGCEAILSDQRNTDWPGVLFKGKEKVAIGKIANYAGVPLVDAERAVENIANEAIVTVKRSAGLHPAVESVKSLMNAQRHSILVYLPAAMQMGDLLNEETLDDRTNKMEGLFSNLMHAIENRLSGSDQSKYP